MYLHWSLPDGLTHAPESAAGEDAGARMPAIPNRWLVLRFAAAGAACRGWVVESDTLTGVREGVRGRAGSSTLPRRSRGTN